MAVGALVVGMSRGSPRQVDPSRIEFCWNCSSFMPDLLVEYAEQHGGWYPRGGADQWASLGMAINDGMDVHFFSCHELTWIASRQWHESGVLGREGCCYSYIEGIRVDDRKGLILAYFDPPGVPAGEIRIALIHDPGKWLQWESYEEGEFKFLLQQTREFIASRDAPGVDPTAPPGEAGLEQLMGSGFFDWGFQKRVEAQIREGAKNHQNAIENSIGMILLPIPGGTCQIGLAKEDAATLRAAGIYENYISNRMPRHEVQLSPFLAAFEPVTDDQWQAYTGVPPSYAPNPGDPGAGYALGVSWQEAVAFCDWLTQRERAEGLIDFSEVYSLPTEAQWEWMASGGSGGPWPHGKTALRGRERVMDPYGLMNGFGVVAWVWAFELCMDVYDATYYSRSPAVDPFCSEAADVPAKRVMRGGNRGSAWGATGNPHHNSYRTSIHEQVASIGNVGFRVVLTKAR